MQALAANPKADVCYTARVHFGEDRGHNRPQASVPVPAADDIREALFRNTTFLPSSVVIRRSTFLAVGGFDTTIRVVDDWDLWMRLLNAGVVFAACHEPLLQYRIHSESVSRNVHVWLAETDMVYRRYILPRTRGPQRLFRYNRFRSEHESAGAMLLRVDKNAGSTAMMAKSILRDPFHDPQRYKVLAHMLLN